MDDFYIQWPGVASNGLRFVQWPRPCPIAAGSLSDRPIAVGRPSNGVRPTPRRSIWPIPPTSSLNDEDDVYYYYDGLGEQEPQDDDPASVG